MDRTRIIRLPEALEVSGMSRSLLYEKVKQGTFPKPVRLSSNSVGWVLTAVEDWVP